jgi:hypothetical protein
LRNNLSSDADYAEYSAALDALYTTPPAAQPAPVQPLAYLYHDATSPELASPMFHSTLLVFAGDRRPKLRGETPLCLCTPPAAQRTWQGLTDEEITDIWAESSPYYHEDDFARAIEAKLKEKNT